MLITVLNFVTTLFSSFIIVCIWQNRNKAWAKRAKEIFYLTLCDFMSGIVLVLHVVYARRGPTHNHTKSVLLGVIQ